MRFQVSFSLQCGQHFFVVRIIFRRMGPRIISAKDGHTHGLRKTTGLVLTTYSRKILGSGFNFRRFFPRRMPRKLGTSYKSLGKHSTCLRSCRKMFVVVSSQRARLSRGKETRFTNAIGLLSHEIVMANLKIANFKSALNLTMLRQFAFIFSKHF